MFAQIRIRVDFRYEFPFSSATKRMNFKSVKLNMDDMKAGFSK